jgi:hypothetical protein
LDVSVLLFMQAVWIWMCIQIYSIRCMYVNQWLYLTQHIISGIICKACCCSHFNHFSNSLPTPLT